MTHTTQITKQDLIDQLAVLTVEAGEILGVTGDLDEAYAYLRGKLDELIEAHPSMRFQDLMDRLKQEANCRG